MTISVSREDCNGKDTCISDLNDIVYTFLQHTFSIAKGKFILKYARFVSLVYPEGKMFDFCGPATKQFHVFVLRVDSHTLILCCKSLKLLEIWHATYRRLYVQLVLSRLGNFFIFKSN